MPARKTSSAPVALVCHTIVTVSLIVAYVVTRDGAALAAALAYGAGAGAQKAVGG